MVFALERYYSCLDNPDVLAVAFKLNDKLNKMFKHGPSFYRPKHTPVENFQRLYRKIKVLIRLRKVSRSDSLASPYKNPLIKKMFLTLALWLFVCGLVYFVFPIIGNTDTRVTGISKVLCNDYYIEENSITLEGNRCHTLWKGIPFYNIFFLLNMIYVYFSALQIRAGFNLSRESVINKDWTSHIGYAKFKVYEALPLLREINTTIEFCAANTSLTYLEWLKLEDIRGAMVQAKYQAERRLVKVVGDAINGLVKICIGFSALIIVVLIIVSPMLLFSDLNPSQDNDEVVRARMDVDLIFERMGNFSLLSNLNMFASPDGNGNKQKLKFSNIMEQSIPFTPESIKNLADLLSKASTNNKNLTEAVGGATSIFLKIKLAINVYIFYKDQT